MRTATTSLLILAALATCSCKSTGFLAKREAEKCCPTDIRKTVPWCAGEDALFQGPCEPNATFYGYKPTCWGIWPTSGAEWRDAHCGTSHHDAVLTNLTNQNPELIQLPPLQSMPAESVEQDDPEKKVELERSITVEGPQGSSMGRQEDLPKPNLGPALPSKEEAAPKPE